MMHSGHYNALRQAKSRCETLVVGVIATEEIIKRKGQPVMTLEERLTLGNSWL
jgi:ethanolamine-phosphate cytidylyltransferase